MFVLAAPNIDVNGIPFQEAFHNDGEILRATFKGIFELQHLSCIISDTLFLHYRQHGLCLQSSSRWMSP